MTAAGIIDIGAVLIVVFFTAMGARKGLFRTLAGVLVLILALAGAGYLSTRLSDPLTEWAMPRIEEKLEERMGAALEGAGQSASLDDVPSEVLEAAPQQVLIELPEGMELPESVQNLLSELIEQRLSGLGSAAGSAVRSALQEAMRDLLRQVMPFLLARVVFLVSFLVLSALLKAVVGMIGPVWNIPGLHMLNTVGGALAGLVQGAAIVLALVWLLACFGEYLGLEGLENSIVIGLLSGRVALFPVPSAPI